MTIAAMLSADDYSCILKHDLMSFIERSFYELNPQTPFFTAPYIELMASKLEACRHGKIKRLIINLPPRQLKSLSASIAFVAWLLGHDPTKHVIAASRRKGKWTGGTVPLGYEAKDKKLVVNKTEAETVRTIFRLYLELKSFAKLVAELDRRGIVTKCRDTKVAKYNGGIPFTYGPLAYLLKNRVYVGEVHHGGKWFKGEQKAILDRLIFEQVRANPMLTITTMSERVGL
jgi:Recombinase